MKIRNIPFGYKYENGQKVINEKESVAVIEIFTRYLKRERVMAIANDLTERRIEYMPNEFEWNKSRVLRVVKDARYNGESRIAEITELLDGIKNRTMEYDDRLVRQIIEAIIVESKEKIKVIFIGG